MVLLVLLPESIEAIVHDIFEVSVRLGGSLEGRMARVHGEQDHSKRENVSVVALVPLSSFDLWCHITRCPNVRLVDARVISARNLNSEAKIHYLRLEALI